MAIYDVLYLLGGGGEGEVFLARERFTRVLYALKFSASLWPSDARSQLARELDRCSRAAGDGAVQVVDYNLDAERPFLVFELAGGTLADEIRRVRSDGAVFHPAVALLRIAGVLIALAMVHQRGIIHRDVKPENMGFFNGRLKLSFFCTFSGRYPLD